MYGRDKTSRLWALNSILRGFRVKVRKRSIIVDAVQYERGKGLEDGFVYGELDSMGYIPREPTHPDALQIPYISTLEGPMFISEGDYIITGIKGERYPIKKDIFELSYDVLTDEENIHCVGDACPPDRVIRQEQTMNSLINRLDNLESHIGKLHNMMVNDKLIGSLMNARL